MKAIVIYQSRTGITKRLGSAVHDYLRERKHESGIFMVTEVKPEDVEQADLVFLGCWTSGLFLMFQHPDRTWKKHVKRLPSLDKKKVCLFTTYKIATGSMFRSMSRNLGSRLARPADLTLRSKDGSLSGEQKVMIDGLIKG